jgi:hypothetical protein
MSYGYYDATQLWRIRCKNWINLKVL